MFLARFRELPGGGRLRDIGAIAALSQDANAGSVWWRGGLACVSTG